MYNFAERLWNLRTSANMTQQGLADAIYTSRRAVVKWESGQTQPTCDSIIALSTLFHVSTDYLLGLTDNKIRS